MEYSLKSINKVIFTVAIHQCVPPRGHAKTAGVPAEQRARLTKKRLANAGQTANVA